MRPAGALLAGDVGEGEPKRERATADELWMSQRCWMQLFVGESYADVCPHQTRAIDPSHRLQRLVHPDRRGSILEARQTGICLMRSLAAFIVALSFFGLIDSAAAAKRVALVIGNNDYRHLAPLQKAVGDARGYRAVFEARGFRVF